MRPLVVDDELREKVAAIKAYARQNHYRPGRGVRPPGEDPGHVLRTAFGFRVVYSLTEAGDKIFRHLSVSVPGRALPNPVAVWTLAQEFGFTGWEQGRDPAPGWDFKINRADNCIVVVQEVQGDG